MSDGGDSVLIYVKSINQSIFNKKEGGCDNSFVSKRWLWLLHKEQTIKEVERESDEAYSNLSKIKGISEGSSR